MPITPQELIANLGDLPPLPQVAAQVVRIAADPESTAEDLRKVISTDQALTTQVLKIANSAMFGMMREVKTLSQAIMTLGFSTIKSVVIASSAKNLYSRGAVGLREKLLWEHALVTAIASRTFARAVRFPRVEEAFIGGLLHDVGKAVMSIKFPDRYSTIIQTIYNGQGEILEMELDTFGFDHAMVGEALLGRWNLAVSLQEAVRWHHAPSLAKPEHQILTATVAMANHFALTEKIGIGTPESLEEATKEALEILKMSPEALAEHEESLREALAVDKGMISEF